MRTLHGCWITLIVCAAPLFADPPAKGPDPRKLSPVERHIFASAQRGADFLNRQCKPDGRFQYGLLPALRQPMEGDHFPRQVLAAGTLARAGKYFGDERALAAAQVALLSLLLETTADPKEPSVRFTAAPSQLVHRPATVASFLTAIYELPQPPADLAEKADQFANFLAKQARQDGSLDLAESKEQLEESIRHYAGPVLLGIARSQAVRPASWKPEFLKRARSHYLTHWRQNKNVPEAAGLTAAFAEAFHRTQDKEYASAVFEMSDWLVTVQYRNLEARRQHWVGGFLPWTQGNAVSLPPDVSSALPAESLAHACRVASALGDVNRLQQYRQSTELALSFLSRLQYTEGNTQHFADWYQKFLQGGFYASFHDGNLRLDYTQQSLAAMVAYLEIGDAGR